MNKGIIVMDIPESCKKCKMYEAGGFNESLEPFDGVCLIEKRCMNSHKVTKGRPYWCPISPMPEKAYVREYDRCKSVYDLSDRSRCIGWNACIDAIGGSEDEM